MDNSSPVPIYLQQAESWHAEAGSLEEGSFGHEVPKVGS